MTHATLSHPDCKVKISLCGKNSREIETRGHKFVTIGAIASKSDYCQECLEIALRAVSAENILLFENEIFFNGHRREL